MLTFITSTGKEFRIKAEYIGLSKKLEDIYKERKSRIIHIDIGTIISELISPNDWVCDNDNLFEFLVEFLKIQKGISPKEPLKPIISNEINDNVESKENINFINNICEKGIANFKLYILFFHAFECESLTRLAVTKLATLMKGKTPAQLVKLFEQKTDLIK